MRLIKDKTYYTKPWYDSWRCMLDRCYREKAWNYKDYGGRGIKVCDEWHDIEAFGKWAEKTGYEKGLTLALLGLVLWTIASIKEYKRK